MSPPLSLSVIVPTLNAAPRLAATLARVRATLPAAEIIVTDGGCTDATARLAAAPTPHIIACPRGRGHQLAAGSARARGDLLLFLHAATLLPADAASVLARAFARLGVQLGTFRLTFDGAGPFLRACTWLTRFDSVFTRFGDQTIAVRHEFYTSVGGVPPRPLFEDVDFLQRAPPHRRLVISRPRHHLGPPFSPARPASSAVPKRAAAPGFSRRCAARPAGGGVSR